VIAAENNGQRTRVERGGDGRIQGLTDARDLVDVLLGLRNLRRHIPVVHDGVPEIADLLAESGDAERGGPHVDAATSSAKVERNTDDVNWFQLLAPQSDFQLPKRQLPTLGVGHATAVGEFES
jgi:hypothetical protein